MADATVGFLLKTLSGLLLDHHNLTADVKKDINDLHRNLNVFNAFLRNSLEMRENGNQMIEELVKNIREVVFEMEDIIDVFINENHDKEISWLEKIKFIFRHSTAKKIKDLIGKVENCRKDIFMATDAAVDQHNKSAQFQVRPPRKKDVVGFVDEADYLRRRLTADTPYFDVVSLVGMLGLGKTTLAWMIYNDPAISCKFPIRFWLPISQEFSNRDIFLAILRQHTTIDDIRDKEDYELADMVFNLLNRGCFLIVFDDVWEKVHWDRLNRALPSSNHKGKILITTRNKDVANYASKPRDIRELRLFYPEESWELLRQEAIRSKDCPPRLEALGRVIAGKCEGLPLAIVIIGGILAINFSLENQTATEKEWKEMPDQVFAYLSKIDPENRMNKLISLSYNKLPYHLRSCFLYLGIFPEDYEIRVSKLIQLWITEGFIQENRYFSLEKTAEMYLSELINRNLVKSERFKHDGKVKTCRVHDTLRDFCHAEAEAENLFKEIKYIRENFATPVSEIGKYRRLSLHSNCHSFITSKNSAPRVRSFVCFSKDDYHVNAERSKHIIQAFKYIKVFDVKPFKFESSIDKSFYELVYMKYIALSTNFKILHSRFKKFWNIQTLIVETLSPTLEVEADIWNMRQLRCFKTNVYTKLPNPTESSKYGKELQTLGTIAVESFTAELSSQACNLRKLGIRGNLASLCEGRAGSFVSLSNLTLLEKLKLINDVHPFPAIDMPLNGLPQPHQFPAALTSLTLCNTYLKWHHMETLGSLAKLEVLKLKDWAFVGDIWKTADGGFKLLQLLYIEKTDLAVWNASAHHFPELRGLVLQKCEKLQEIPMELAEIPNLQMLDLLNCESAAASAKKIKEVKKNTEAEGCAFMLSIFPAPTE